MSDSPAEVRTADRLRVAARVAGGLFTRAGGVLRAAASRWDESSSRRLWVGAFGKHPIAADHLPSLAASPADTPPSLGAVAAELYFGGIRECVIRGLWNEGDPHLRPFGHRFAHRPIDRPNHLVLGRIWPSRDNIRPKPRTNFPMIAIAEFASSVTTDVPAALSHLQTLEADLRNAATDDEAVNALAAAQRAMDELPSVQSPPTADAADWPKRDGVDRSRWAAPALALYQLAAVPSLPERSPDAAPERSPAGRWVFAANGDDIVDRFTSPLRVEAFTFLRSAC